MWLGLNECLLNDSRCNCVAVLKKFSIADKVNQGGRTGIPADLLISIFVLKLSTFWLISESTHLVFHSHQANWPATDRAQPSRATNTVYRNSLQGLDAVMCECSDGLVKRTWVFDLNWDWLPFSKCFCRLVYFRNVSKLYNCRALRVARSLQRVILCCYAVNINMLTLLAFSFAFAELLVSAEGQACIQVLNDRCIRPYESAVDAAEPATNRAICTALAVFLRCVQGVKNAVKSCNSNIHFHTVSTLIPRQMKDRNCGNVSLPTNGTALPSAKTPATPAPKQPACMNFTFAQTKPSKGQIRKNPHDFRLCALFGDPHLKTFTEERQTCVVEGAWPLIDSEYFSVQVTNVPLVAGSSATATNTVRAFKLFSISIHRSTERVQIT